MVIAMSKEDIQVSRIIFFLRVISLLVTSGYFLISQSKRISVVSLIVVMFLAIFNILLYVMYLSVQQNPTRKKIIICVEFIGNLVIIFLSGGFYSPFVWYFISTMMLAMFELKFSIVICMALFYFITLILGSLNQGKQGPDFERQVFFNVCFGYLIIVVMMLGVVRYIVLSNQRRVKIAEQNEKLRLVQEQLEFIIKSGIQIYETMDIFTADGIDDISKQILMHFKKLTECKSCALLVLDHEDIKVSNMGLEDRILKEVSKTDIFLENRDFLRKITRWGKDYDIFKVQYSNRTVAVILYEKGEKIPYSKEIELFLKLVGVIIKRSDYDSLGEKLIISEEQNRIANEIHDTVLQKLFAVSCSIFRIKKRLLEDKISQESIEVELDRIRESIDHTMVELREAVYGMSWQKNGEDVFIKRINQYIQEVSMLHHIEIDSQITGSTMWLLIHQKTTLYRIICECVNNSIRHGQATYIKVILKMTHRNSKVLIYDNGLGYQLKDDKNSENGGIGLHNLHLAVEVQNGRIKLNSTRKRGTSVLITLPTSK